MDDWQIDLALLVDDNDTDNFVNKQFLERKRFAKTVLVENSGKSALQYLEDNVDNLENIPDLIFLDIKMPIVDGSVFLYEYDNLPSPVKEKSKLVILYSTAADDVDKVMDNTNVIGQVTKPITEQSLANLVKALQTKQQ